MLTIKQLQFIKETLEDLSPSECLETPETKLSDINKLKSIRLLNKAIRELRGTQEMASSITLIQRK